uniref:KRAB domain-containing protein n=1 Tax=Anolis carolinensis TaxID=28377 RepID=A0A803TWJ0_ANOCA
MYFSVELQGPIAFEDVAVDFSLEEWVLLNPDQKALHKQIMEEMNGIVVFPIYLTTSEDACHRCRQTSGENTSETWPYSPENMAIQPSVYKKH